MKDYISIIKNSGITGALIAEIIEGHKLDRERMKAQYERYKADDVPIFRREVMQVEDFETGAVKRIDNRVNNTLNNSFDSELVDTKIGYMFGIPINYDVDKEGAPPTLLQQLEQFTLRNSVDDKDSELGKKAAICGYGARLCYIDSDGNERVTNIDPWEVVILSEIDELSEPTYAIRYFTKGIETGEQDVALFYDGTHEYRFVSNNNTNGYTLDNKRLHMYDYCPLFAVPNNDELKGDAEKVYKLIDAYDRTLSDASNEIEQYRLAYLVLRGAGMDEEDMNQAKRSGIWELLGETDDVKYLTKDINDNLIEHHLDRLEENILRLAKSVNFGDGTFGTQVTGVALKYKLMALESKCMMMERKMTAALRYQFKVLCSSWGKRNKGTKDDYLKIFFTFKRNIPIDLLNEAQTTAALAGFVSERTRLSALSIVDDAQYEMDEMEKEKENIPPLNPNGDDE